MKYTIEIYAAEGGDHAKRLIKKQASIYEQTCLKEKWKHKILRESISSITIEICGDDLYSLLKESGGHRWQGVSGHKVHTSTVTVAVLDNDKPLPTFDKNDVNIIRTKDSGKGGQHRNKTESCIIATHTPTGLTAKAADRKQGQNLTNAMSTLEQKVLQHYQEIWDSKLSLHRIALLGTGARGDKIRTYREQDNIVIDHNSNQKLLLTNVLKGNLP